MKTVPSWRTSVTKTLLVVLLVLTTLPQLQAEEVVQDSGVWGLIACNTRFCLASSPTFKEKGIAQLRSPRKVTAAFSDY